MTVPVFAAVVMMAGAPANPVVAGPVVPILDTSLAGLPALKPVAVPSDVPQSLATETAAPVVLVKPVDPPPLATTLEAAAPPRPAPAHVATGDESEIVVRARPKSVPGDPFQGANIKSFELTQSVDRAVIRPVSRAYQRIVPDPLRSGFRNVLNNLREPVVFLNYLLQFKPGKAVETLGRFAVNSTVGVAGLFDMAKRKPFKLPRRRNGFGNTLGYYGVGPGPFFFLPIVGATTLRDFFGDNADRLFLPAIAGKPFNKPLYAITVGLLSSLDQRAEFDEKLQELHEGSQDPYASTREDYLNSRQAAIDELHGKPRYVAPPAVVPTLPARPSAETVVPATVATPVIH